MDAKEIREKCFKDMQRFIENCRKDSTPDVPAYDTLTVMLATLNDVGSEGFGESAWQKKKRRSEKTTHGLARPNGKSVWY